VSHYHYFLATPELADRLAELPLQGIAREYPNKLDHVINGPQDLRSPRELHPAFYGCYDWHSAVHGHWTLIRLLKQTGLTKQEEARALLRANLTPSNILAEVEYLHQPNRESFERPYGWAWLLKLAAELRDWEDGDGVRWAAALKPLEEAIVERFLRFLPLQTYPIRSGVHSNTAFSLLLALSYATAAGQTALWEAIRERTLYYFEEPAMSPEPNGADFLSPSLTMAALMMGVVSPEEFRAWFARLFPNGLPNALRLPALVSDRDDPQIGHLDGLNLSRAWCLRAIANGLTPEDPQAETLRELAHVHLEASMPHLSSGNYNGEHWLATFATLVVTSA